MIGWCGTCRRGFDTLDEWTAHQHPRELRQAPRRILATLHTRAPNGRAEIAIRILPGVGIVVPVPGCAPTVNLGADVVLDLLPSGRLAWPHETIEDDT